jgi:hypothetical protein
MSYLYLGVAFVVTAVLGFTCLIALQRVVGWSFFGYSGTKMKKTIAYLSAAGAVIWIDAAQAQGINNARDGSGNLVERGAATRTYTSTPMANSHITPPPAHGYVANARPHAVVIRAPR